MNKLQECGFARAVPGSVLRGLDRHLQDRTVPVSMVMDVLLMEYFTFMLLIMTVKQGSYVIVKILEHTIINLFVCVFLPSFFSFIRGSPVSTMYTYF